MGLLRLKATFFAICLTILSNSAYGESLWDYARGRRPTTIHEYLDFISEIFLRGNTHSNRIEATYERRRTIHFLDVEVKEKTGIHTLLDLGSRADTEGWIELLQIDRTVEGKRMVRVYFHPQDTKYEKDIRKSISQSGDKIIFDSKLENAGIQGFAGSSRSIFFSAEDKFGNHQIFQMKTSTNNVNKRRKASKLFTPLEALWGVLSSSFFRDQVPGLMVQESIAIRQDKRNATIIRHIGEVRPSELHGDVDASFEIWMPGHFFDVDNSDLFPSKAVYESYHKQFMKLWKQRLAHAMLYRTMFSRSIHTQNAIVKVDLRSGKIIDVQLMDATEFEPDPEDLKNGIAKLNLNPEEAEKVWNSYSRGEHELTSEKLKMSGGRRAVQLYMYELLKSPEGQKAKRHAVVYGLYIELTLLIEKYEKRIFNLSELLDWKSRFVALTPEEQNRVFSEIDYFLEDRQQFRSKEVKPFEAAMGQLAIYSFLVKHFKDNPLPANQNLDLFPAIGESYAVLGNAFNFMEPDDILSIKSIMGEDVYREVPAVLLAYENSQVRQAVQTQSNPAENRAALTNLIKKLRSNSACEDLFEPKTKAQPRFR